MAEFVCVKTFGALKPIDPIGQAYLKSVGVGEVLKVRTTKARNPAFHRKFFALLNLGFENQEVYTDFEKWRRAVIIEAGFYEDLRLIDGTTIREAKSISFARMDDLEFSRLFNEAVSIIAKFLGTEDALLAGEVHQFMTVGAA